jgi:hypothetical protein
MTELTKNQLIADLARDVVAEIAPQELPMFRAQSGAYFRDPEGALKRQAGKDEMLGFGTGTAATFMTPAVLAVTTVVVNFVVAAVTESIQEEAKDFLGEAVQSIFKKLRSYEKKEGKKDEGKQDVSKEEPLSLTPEHLKKIRELVVTQALQLGLSGKTAVALADSFTGRLVVSSS